MLAKNGTVTKTLTLPASSGLAIRARGDQYMGAPGIQVSLDGTVVAASAVLAVLLIANGELAIGRRRLPSPEGKDSGYG